MKLALLFALFLLASPVLGQPQELWNRTFGGPYGDGAWQVQQTDDGGFIVVGYTCSFGERCDLWLLKTDQNGSLLWDRVFGGSGEDIGYAVQQTDDGGYIVLGSTDSFGVGGARLWLIKADASGSLQWDRVYGGFLSSEGVGGWSVREAEDGYVVAGYVMPQGAAGRDLWLMKVDPQGEKLWESTFGGAGDEVGYSLENTSDGGFIAVGSTIPAGKKNEDVLVVKTDSQGVVLWNKTFSGEGDEVALSVMEAENGSFLLAGRRSNPQDKDVLLMKINPSGALLWDRTLGGPGDQVALSVSGWEDGYVVAGRTSSDQDQDLLFIITTTMGQELQRRLLGGRGDDLGTCIRTVEDGWIVAGITDSYGRGSEDAWLVRLEADSDLVYPTLVEENISSPAPAVAQIEPPQESRPKIQGPVVDGLAFTKDRPSWTSGTDFKQLFGI